ncbi:MAG: ankyrin repeat domain-containing protein [Desulfobacterales bacterium]|nr:ankyrin repeat domain-containing protein [Desulfobacterales bacterium]
MWNHDIFAYYHLIITGSAVLPKAACRLPITLLLEAVKKNDVQAVRKILEASSNHYEINQLGVTGDLPLTRAASNGNLEIVKLLVEHGAVVDIGKEGAIGRLCSKPPGMAILKL